MTHIQSSLPRTQSLTQKEFICVYVTSKQKYYLTTENQSVCFVIKYGMKF